MTKETELDFGGGTVRVRSLPSLMGGVVLGTTAKQADAVRAYAERISALTGEAVDELEASVWKVLVDEGAVAAIKGLR